MADQVIPVTGLDTIGLIEDIPPVSLPPAAVSDCRNVRFRDNAIHKMEGDIDILPYVRMADADILKYIIWWPNPNLSIFSLGYYLLIVEQSGEDNAYLIKVDEAGTFEEPLELIKSKDNFKGSFTTGGHWQHTFFQGGFSLIINNGLQTPHYILDSEENVTTEGVNDFLPLPGWDSYAVTVDGEEMMADYVTAGVIRTYGDFLVAGNLVERTAVDGDVIRALPNIIRSSDIAAPGGIPQNWNPFADAVNTADEFVVTGDGIVVDFVELQGNMYVYSNSSISVISRTGNPVTPLSVRPVTSAYGALATDSVIEFDGRHLVVGSQDIYVFAGHPGSIASIADTKVRDAFYRRLNLLDIDNMFVLRYQQKDEIWICYPSQTATGGRADEALIWNYRNQTWTKRDLQGVIAGDIGPIPGGGIPRAELGFDDSLFTATSEITGEPQVNSISITEDITMIGGGEQHMFSIQVPDNLPPHVSTGNPVYEVVLRENFWTGGGDCPPLRFIARAIQGDDVLLNVNIDLPEFVGIDPNNPQFVYGSDEYEDNVTDIIRDHLLDHSQIGEDDNVNIRMHPLITENFQVGFMLEFQNVFHNVEKVVQNSLGEDETILSQEKTNLYTPILDIVKDRLINSEYDVDLDDRPLTADESNDNSIDRVGEKLDDQSGSAGDVYSFNFEDILDDINDYVFFFKSARNIVVGNEHYTYAGWPADATVESGTTGGETTEVDGGDAGAGDTVSEAMDGDRRVATDFTDAVVVNQPLFGSDIITLLGNPQDVHEFSLRVTPEAVVDEFNLIAYKIPKASNGTPDYSKAGGSLPGSDDAAAITFDITLAEFDKDTDSWSPNGVDVISVVALLHYNGEDDADQRAAFKQSIVSAFSETDLFTAALDDETITVTSRDFEAYSVVMSIEGGELKDGGVPVISSFNPMSAVQQGISPFDNSSIIPPCVRVIHNDPDIPFFSFDTGLIRLVKDVGDTLEIEEQYGIINTAIQAVAPGQWEYTTGGTWTSVAVTYDESMGDTGVPYPNADGTYDFPAERKHSDFVISGFSAGVGNDSYEEPTSNIDTPGVYEDITLGSHFVMRVSNGISYLFYVGGEHNGTGATIAEAGLHLKSEIERRIPELQVVPTSTGVTIEPAVIGENSVFVLESYLNNSEDTIGPFRMLLDSELYTQDPENPQVSLTLPDTVLVPTSSDFPVSTGPDFTQVVTTDFDLVRTWSESQVNFSVEFPIFASGRTFHDGNTVNKVLAGDIGYSIPIFSQTTTGTQPYSSFVERSQMGLTPEFTTESVQSLALWTDGGSPAEFLGDLRYNVLQLNMSVTNSPGQRADLNNPQYINTHYISEDYKMDTRLTGRFLNWRLSDEVDEVSTNPGGKTFSQQSDWRVSGMQWKIRPAGRR